MSFSKFCVAPLLALAAVSGSAHGAAILNGTYALTGKAKGPTKVTYDLEVDLKIPMIGMLKRKAEKVIIDTALKELKKLVESMKA